MPWPRLDLRSITAWHGVGPGLFAAAAAVSLAFVINGWFPAITPLTVAVELGMVAAVRAGAGAGKHRRCLRFAESVVRRPGIALGKSCCRHTDSTASEQVA